MNFYVQKATSLSEAAQEQNARIGIIARCDNTGLGVMSVDFFRNLVVQKVLIIPTPTNYVDRLCARVGVSVIVCRSFKPAPDEIDFFLQDLDVVVAFERPYNWTIFSRARQYGVK